ncbi:hypothetical protein KAU11_05870, partial [Candidatus Babeliales bacterium]|nr:hypothetical protein [Candidatus Babeliales bacterium]
MKTFKRREGSIVLITLIMLSVVLVLVDRFVRSVNVHGCYTKLVLAKEQANMLALGGISCACAQITAAIRGDYDKKENKDASKKEEKITGPLSDKQLQSLYKKLLVHLNRWQEFKLDAQRDGVEGVIRFCITSEEGKIPINSAYDFEKNEFKKPYAELIKKTTFTTEKKEKDAVIKEMALFFKERGKKLDDASQLLPSRHLELFYKPVEKQEKTHDARVQPSGLYDFFTVWGDEKGVNPLLLSDALRTGLGFSRLSGDKEKQKKQEESVEKVTKKINRSWAKDWKSNFKQIMPLYSSSGGDAGERGQKIFEKLEGALSTQIEPQVFSVLSCAKVSDTQQCVLAVIRRILSAENKETKPAKSEKDSDVQMQTLSFL